MEKDVLAYETRLRSVWCFNTESYVQAEKPTSQYKAYNQLALRQQHGKPMYIIIHAEAGYGKSDLSMAFMVNEKKLDRECLKPGELFDWKFFFNDVFQYVDKVLIKTNNAGSGKGYPDYLKKYLYNPMGEG